MRLRALPLEEAGTLLAGGGGPPPDLSWHEEYPTTETLDALGMIVAAHSETGWAGDRVPPWWIHQIVLDDLVVGDIGFHGPPAGAGLGSADAVVKSGVNSAINAEVNASINAEIEVEIGYSVVSGLRGRGIASCACRLILVQAWRDGAARVRAETDPDNAASQQVLLRSGFVPQGYCRFVIERPPDGLGADG